MKDRAINNLLRDHYDRITLSPKSKPQSQPILALKQLIALAHQVLTARRSRV